MIIELIQSIAETSYGVAYLYGKNKIIYYIYIVIINFSRKTNKVYHWWNFKRNYIGTERSRNTLQVTTKLGTRSDI